jgi:hypothetical protein
MDSNKDRIYMNIVAFVNIYNLVVKFLHFETNSMLKQSGTPAGEHCRNNPFKRRCVL